MKKFFLISQVFYPDEVSTAGLFTDLCIHLINEDYKVEVWCAQPSYTNSDRQKRKIEYKGILIKYLLSTSFQKSRILGRFINILTFSISVAFRLVFSRNKAPVFTHTTPPTLGFIVSLICRLKKREFIYIILDIFPEGMIRLGMLSRSNVFVKLWEWHFKISLLGAAKIIVVGRDMGKYLRRTYSQIAPKIKYIPLWHNDKLITPIPVQSHPFMRNYNLDGKFIIQYSGNMGLWNDMETIGKVVNQQLTDVFYVFIGGGMRKSELTDNITAVSSKNTLFLPFQPQEKFAEVVSACHVGLVSLRAELEGIAVPSKIYGIMASGTPVIAIVPEGSEIDLIIREEYCGITVPPGNAEALSQAILLLKNDEQLRIEMSNNGRRAFERKYTTVIQSLNYMRILGSISGYRRK